MTKGLLRISDEDFSHYASGRPAALQRALAPSPLLEDDDEVRSKPQT